MKYFLRGILFFVAIMCSQFSMAAQNLPLVLLKTDLGDIVIELYPHEAPVTVRSFLDYVDNGFYNDTIFHRVAPGFVIQGGGVTADFTPKKTREPVKNESNSGLKNEVYTVAMAHAGNNDLSGAQFFINLQTNPILDSNSKELGYTVFGKIIEGMEIAENISLAPRGMSDAFPEAPNTAIHILKIERIDRNKLSKVDTNNTSQNENKFAIPEKNPSSTQ